MSLLILLYHLCPCCSYNLGVIMDSNLSVSDHVSALFKYSFSHPRDLLQAIFLAISITTPLLLLLYLIFILDLTNASLYYNLPASQIKCPQLNLASTTHAVTRTPEFSHIFILMLSYLFTGSE
jgi:hypothetical protein